MKRGFFLYLQVSVLEVHLASAVMQMPNWVRDAGKSVCRRFRRCYAVRAPPAPCFPLSGLHEQPQHRNTKNQQNPPKTSVPKDKRVEGAVNSAILVSWGLHFKWQDNPTLCRCSLYADVHGHMCVLHICLCACGGQRENPGFFFLNVTLLFSEMRPLITKQAKLIGWLA